MTNSTGSDDRQRRLADALRENLRRRKAHGREAARNDPDAGQVEGEIEAVVRPNPANKPA